MERSTVFYMSMCIFQHVPVEATDQQASKYFGEECPLRIVGMEHRPHVLFSTQVPRIGRELLQRNDICFTTAIVAWLCVNRLWLKTLGLQVSSSISHPIYVGFHSLSLIKPHQSPVGNSSNSVILATSQRSQRPSSSQIEHYRTSMWIHKSLILIGKPWESPQINPSGLEIPGLTRPSGFEARLSHAERLRQLGNECLDRRVPCG